MLFHEVNGTISPDSRHDLQRHCQSDLIIMTNIDEIVSLTAKDKATTIIKAPNGLTTQVYNSFSKKAVFRYDKK